MNFVVFNLVIVAAEAALWTWVISFELAARRRRKAQDAYIAELRRRNA